MVTENNDKGSKRDPLVDLEITPISTVTTKTESTTTSTTPMDAPVNPSEGFTAAEETGDNLLGAVGDDDWGLLKRGGWKDAGKGAESADGNGETTTDSKPGTTSDTGATGIESEILGFKSLLGTASDSTVPVSYQAPFDPAAVPEPLVKKADDGQPAVPEPLKVKPAEDPKVVTPPADVKPATEVKDAKDVVRPADKTVDPPKLENLQKFLLEKLSSTPQDVVKQKLVEATQRGIEDFINGLAPEAKLSYAKILNDPERLRKLAETDLKERALKVVDDQLKSGKLPAADAEKLKLALDKGELPAEAVKLLLENEKQQGQFGPCTKALFSTIIDKTQSDTRTNVGNAIFNDRPLPKTDALPFPVDDKGKLNLDQKTNDSALKGDLDFVKLAPGTVPTEAELKKLDGLIEFNKAFVKDANPNLTKFQTALEQNLGKLDTQRLFNAMRTEAKVGLERQFKDTKKPDEIAKLADQNLQQLVEASLTRQLKAGLITPDDKVKQLASVKDGIITPATAQDLLKQERLCNTEGIMTRATAHCVEGFYNNRLATAEDRQKRDNLKVDSKAERLSIGPKEAGASINADTMVGAAEKIEKLEKWLQTVEVNRNPQIDKLHGMLTGMSQTMDPSKVGEHLKQNMVPRVEEQFRKKQLPADVQKELESLDYRDDKTAFKARLLEVAGEQLKVVLKQELEAKVGSGIVTKENAEKLTDTIDSGKAPDILLQSMLEKERADNSFGPVTQSYYGALVGKLNSQIPANFVRLAQSGLPLPDGAPSSIQVTLDREGRPLLKDSLVVEIAGALAEGREPRKSVDITNFNEVPGDDKLTEIYKAAKWNTNATIALFDNVQEYQAKMLDATIVKLGRQEWKRDVGTDRTEWMARVGPMVDLTMQVKATAQALKLAEKMAKGNESGIDPKALTKDFPGEVKFDKDGNITDIKLKLPKDLAPSHENTVAINEIQDWLKKHEATAKKTMNELAEAAANDSRILLWQDSPHKGKIMVNGKAEDFNLEKHRVKTEKVMVDGKEKIRIRNYVDYHQSEIHNLWDIGARKVGSREVFSLGSEAEVKKALKTAKVPAEKIDAIYKALKDTESSINNRSEGAIIGDTAADRARISEVLKQAGVENPDKVRDAIYTDYRDYDPGDMVCLYKDDQVQMIMAKNVEAWRANEELWQNIGKVATIAMDVGMVVCGVGHVALAVKGGMMLARSGAVVLRQAIATAIKQNLKHAAKSFALGGSGFVMNNAAVMSTPEGQAAHHVRNAIFALDGVHSLAAMGKGAAIARGLLKGPAVTKESIALARVTKLLDKGNLVSKANSGMMLATELYMAKTLSGDLYKRFFGDHKQEPGLKYGERLLARMNGDGNNATRFLKGTGDALAGGDQALKEKLGGLSDEITKSQKLTGDARTRKTQDLIDRFDRAKEPAEKTMLALGVLALAQKSDGTIPENVGRRTYGYRGELRAKDVPASDFFKVVDEAYANSKSNPETKLMLGRSLLGLQQMDAPQYATMCRELLNDPKTSKDTKIQAILGINECIDSIKANQAGAADDTKAANIFGSFGCSPAALEKTLAEVAKNEKDGDVQAMATAVLDAYKHNNPEEARNLIAKAAGDWQSIKLTQDVRQLEQKVAGLKADDPKRTALEKELHEKREFLDVTLKTIAISNNPNLLEEFAKVQQKADAERDLQAFKALTSRADLSQLQKQLTSLPTDSPERGPLQEKIKLATEKANEEEKKLTQLEKSADIPTIDPKLMPPVPTSVANSLAERLLKDLRGTDAARALMAMDSLSLLKEGKHGLQGNEIRDKLVSLVKMENGILAVEALRRLMPDQIQHLDAATKGVIKAEIDQLLIDDTRISEYDKDATAIAKKTDAAITKIALLDLAPQLFKTGIYGLPEKTDFVGRVVGILEKENSQYAKDFPDLRLAAINSLVGLKDVINELPVDKRQAVYNAIHASMKPPSVMKNVGDIQNMHDGEPNAAIRRAAFAAGKALGDPQIRDFAITNLDSETDPTLATEYGSMEFESLRPDRPDCALRIFEYETNYWSQVLQHARSRISNDQAEKNLRTSLPMLHPETRAQAHHRKDIQLAKADKDADHWYGYSINEWNDAIKKYYHPLLEQGKNQWGTLQTDVSKTGREGDMAKASLMWLATMNNGPRQLEAAQKIREMVNSNIPDKELFYTGIIEAFRHDNTHDKHAVRMEFIRMINDQIPDDPSKPAKMSKQYAGRIVQEALRIELSRMSTTADSGQPSYKDWKEGDPLPPDAERQYELIKLMGKCNYPLAMAELKAIATAQRTESGAVDDVIVHPKVKAAADELLKRLQDTAPRKPGDQDAAIKLLADTSSGRINLFKKLEDAYNVTKEEREFLKSRGPEDQTSLKRRAAINAMVSDGSNTIDSVTAKRNINDACSSNPIRTPNDQRIPHLQSLLKDKDPGVALIAAWHLIKSADPLNTADAGSRAILQNQPFYREALQKMNELTKMRVTSESDSQVQKSAEKFLLISQKWNIKEIIADPLATPKIPDGIVGDAFKTLDSHNFRSIPEQRRDALDTLVRVGAEEFHQNKPQLQGQVENLLRQIASTKDATMASAVLETIRRAARDNQPEKDEVDFNRNRTLTFKNGDKTTILEGLDHRQINYPDGSWAKYNFDSNGQVSSYEESYNKGVLKLAGKDFVLGSIIARPNGVVTSDTTDGIRSVKLPAGDSWTYFRGATDAAKCSKALDDNLAPAKTVEEKIAAINESIYGIGPESGPIFGSTDPRIKTIIELMKPDGQATEDSSKLSHAAARTLLEQRNRGIEPGVYEAARNVFIKDELQGTFVKEAPAEKILSEMRDALLVLGRINVVDDPRKAMFVAALESGDSRIKLAAARVIADGHNGAFSTEDRLAAVKTVLNLTRNDKQLQEDKAQVKEAFDIIRIAGKAFGDFEGKIDSDRSVSFKNGDLVKVTYPDGHVNCTWDEYGINKVSFQIKDKDGKDVNLTGDYQEARRADSNNVSPLHWIDATTASTALALAINSGNERIAVGALSAMANAPEPYHSRAVDRLLDKAVTKADGTGAIRSADKLRSVMHSVDQDEQVSIRHSWELRYSRDGVAPYPIPEATLKKYKFPPGATDYDKTKVLLENVGWVYDNAPAQLTGDLKKDAKEINDLYYAGSGINNHRNVVNALFASLKSSPIKDTSDPRADIVKTLAKSPNRRVALAASYALTHASDAKLVREGTDKLIEFSRYNYKDNQQAESKSILRDMIKFGNDVQQKAALESWTKFNEDKENRDSDAPPKLSPSDEVRRYFLHADAKTQANFYSKPLDVRKAMVLAMHNLDKPNEIWTENQLELAIQPPLYTEPIDPFRSFGRFNPDDPFGNPFSRFRVQRTPTRFESLLGYNAPNPTFEPDSRGTYRPLPRTQYLKYDPLGAAPKEKADLAADLQRQLNQWETGTEVEIGKDGKIKLNLDAARLGIKGKTQLRVTGELDDDPIAFMESAPPAMMAQFSRELLALRPDIAEMDSIESTELAVMFKNWISQKSSGKAKPFISGNSYDLAVDYQPDPYYQPPITFNFLENRGRYRDRVPAELKAQEWSTLSKQRDDFRGQKLNEILKQRLEMPKGAEDGLMQWRPLKLGGVQAPELVAAPPLAKLDLYRTNVLQLLPDEVRTLPGGRVSIEQLKRIAADGDAKDDIFVMPGLGRGKDFKVDESSARIIKLVRAQKTRDGLLFLNLEPPKQK